MFGHGKYYVGNLKTMLVASICVSLGTDRTCAGDPCAYLIGRSIAYFR